MSSELKTWLTVFERWLALEDFNPIIGCTLNRVIIGQQDSEVIQPRRWHITGGVSQMYI